MKARIYVTLKQAVLDPQGKAVARSLAHLGFPEVKDVRVGRYVELELDTRDPATARLRIDEMCKQLIANPVIEDYRIEVDG